MTTRTLRFLALAVLLAGAPLSSGCVKKPGVATNGANGGGTPIAGGELVVCQRADHASVRIEHFELHRTALREREADVSFGAERIRQVLRQRGHPRRAECRTR